MFEKQIEVFIDTNIFKGCKYDLSDDSVLKILERYVNNGRVKVYTSNIVVKEVEKHIQEDISRVFSGFRKSRKAALDLINTSIIEGTPIEEFFTLPDKEVTIESAKNKFRNYLKKIDAVVLDNTEINLEKIVEDYFTQKPPFENSERKKNEFPDAIFVAKIKSLFSKEKPIVIITDDRGVHNAFDEEGFLCLRRLKELYNIINRQDEMYNLVIKFIDDNTKEIKELIKEELESTEIEIDGLDCDRKGICNGYEYEETIIEDISNIDFEIFSVNDITDEYILVTTTCEADISAWCLFNDYDNSIWDSEEHEYMYLSSGEVYEEHKAKFEATLKIAINNKKKEAALNIDSVVCDIALNMDTLTGRKIVEQEDPRIMAEADMMDALEEYYKH